MALAAMLPNSSADTPTIRRPRRPVSNGRMRSRSGCCSRSSVRGRGGRGAEGGRKQVGEQGGGDLVADVGKEARRPDASDAAREPSLARVSRRLSHAPEVSPGLSARREPHPEALGHMPSIACKR
jgi:hypothetical protein